MLRPARFSTDSRPQWTSSVWPGAAQCRRRRNERWRGPEPRASGSSETRAETVFHAGNLEKGPRWLPPRRNQRLGLDDVTRIGLARLRRLAVIAEGTVAFRHSRRNTLCRCVIDERVRLGDVAHDPVQDRAQRLGGRQTHVPVGLVDHQLRTALFPQLRGGALGWRATDVPLTRSPGTAVPVSHKPEEVGRAPTGPPNPRGAIG